MESYLLDWASLLLRWLHVITAIAWIGSSFYFVFLDSSLTPPEDENLRKDGATGEIWAVHGGGFYHPVKYAVRPPTLPKHLHWFYWESYSTWLSGFALFTVIYLWNASVYLIDKSRMDWSPGTAIAVALSFLVVFYLLYDAICQIFGQKKHGERIVGVLVALLVVLASYLACQWFAGRAAFLLVGAMLATAMSASVFFWIIPGQRKVVAAIAAGQPVDPVHGQRGKQRSVHNTYFTLPVLFAMLSGHYSFTYNHPHNWIILVAMMAAGAAIRQFFVLRHGYKLGKNRHPLPYALAGAALIVAVVVALAPKPSAVPAAASNGTVEAINSIAARAGNSGPTALNDAQKVPFSAVQQVLSTHCIQCHGAAMQMKNIRLDSPALASQHAAAIYQQAVVSKAMPMGNATGMTDAERALLGAWFKAGAVVQP